MRRPKPVHQMTIAQFEATFTDEESCRRYLIARRWPNGVHCPRCGNAKVYALASGYHWQCTACAPGGSAGYRFSHIAGTIFENTNKPLREWFRVTHLMLTSKKGISALQIQRMMGFGSYGTAHSMCHKIRAALIEPETKLGGIVGSFHKVSRKYMPLYVAEFQFRYNNRMNDDIFGTAIEGC